MQGLLVGRSRAPARGGAGVRVHGRGTAAKLCAHRACATSHPKTSPRTAAGRQRSVFRSTRLRSCAACRCHIGDSTSADMYEVACKLLHGRGRRFLHVPSGLAGSGAFLGTGLNVTYYHERAGTADLCFAAYRSSSNAKHREKATAGLAYGAFSHYGVVGPPYWLAAYPQAPFLSNDTIGMVARDLDGFCDKVRRLRGNHGRSSGAGGDCERRGQPTLVVASGLWDLEAFWVTTAAEINSGSARRFTGSGGRAGARRGPPQRFHARVVARSTLRPAVRRGARTSWLSTLSMRRCGDAPAWGRSDTASMLQQLVRRRPAPRPDGGGRDVGRWHTHGSRCPHQRAPQRLWRQTYGGCMQKPTRLTWEACVS